ncbi:MAG: PEGA domain-containing protein [bacterium]
MKLTTIIIILFLFSFMCYAEDGKVYLEKGIKAYTKDADFDKTISEIQKAIELGLGETSDQIQAHLYMGFAYVGLNKKIEAIVEFAKAINLDPSIKLDPKLYSNKIISVFNEAREGLIDSLTVISVPSGAEVYLNNQKMGITPVKLDSVLVAEHILTIKKNFYQTITTNINVRKGEENRFTFNLSKAEIEIKIDSNPPQSTVYRYGEILGQTPVVLKMMLDQEITIRLAKEGFLDKELKLKIIPEGISISNAKEVIPIINESANVFVELPLAPAHGKVIVNSEPSGANVHIDGVFVGITPLSLDKVTPGNREIAVSIPNFDNVKKKIEVNSDQETSVSFSLGGIIKILTFPSDAKVFINGNYVGNSPLVTQRLSIGMQNIKITKENYEDNISSLFLESGQEREIKIRLIQSKGSLAISSDPTGAEAYLDGEFKGKTPLFIYGVITGFHNIMLFKEGYTNWEKSINIKENEISWCFGTLNRK